LQAAGQWKFTGDT